MSQKPIVFSHSMTYFFSRVSSLHGFSAPGFLHSMNFLLQGFFSPLLFSACFGHSLYNVFVLKVVHSMVCSVQVLFFLYSIYDLLFTLNLFPLHDLIIQRFVHPMLFSLFGFFTLGVVQVH